MRRPPDDQHARIHEEAATWLERLERTVTRDEGRALRRWLESPLHRQIIVTRCKLCHGPEVLAVLRELIPVETFSERVERQYGRILLAICLGVTGLATTSVLLGFVKVWGLGDGQSSLRAEASYRTALADRRTIALPDGGSAALNTATRLLLNYSPLSRDVTLLHGEATFEVRNDPLRPFRVSVGRRELEVRGGAATFNVRRVSPDATEVMVLHGQVMAPAGRSDMPLSPALLRAQVSTGDQIFNANEVGILGAGWQSAWAAGPESIARRIAWRNGRLVFADEPLEDALREIERYTTTTFVLRDDHLRRSRLTAQFKVGDVEGVLRFLRANLGIVSRASGKDAVVLARSFDQP